jgi:hypothetical protein
MGTFTASLRAIGDVRGLPATVELTDGNLRIAAGEGGFHRGLSARAVIAFFDGDCAAGDN